MKFTISIIETTRYSKEIEAPDRNRAEKMADIMLEAFNEGVLSGLTPPEGERQDIFVQVD